MRSLSLDGEWDLFYCNSGEGEALGIPERGLPLPGSFTARVPGDVHLDLIRAGLIDEPLFGCNAQKYRWLEEKDWWYSRTFSVPAGFYSGKRELCFGGIDTTADIWLNGHFLGRHNNMFIPYRVDVGHVLHERD
ncbi:MAG: sugar-binding domain-containing protein, partial [Spirochaetota bacterium]